jgi:hypothetical protein
LLCARTISEEGRSRPFARFDPCRVLLACPALHLFKLLFAGKVSPAKPILFALFFFSVLYAGAEYGYVF